jgi:hypothetical protein
MSGPWFSSSALFCLLCSKPVCLQVFIHCSNMTISSYFPSLRIFPYMLSDFCISFCLFCFLWTTHHSSPVLCRRTAVTQPVKVSFFLDVNTITFSFFHHSLGLLNGLGFISIFYIVCLGLFFLKCGSGWRPSGTFLLHPFIVLSPSYFYCL